MWEGVGCSLMKGKDAERVPGTVSLIDPLCT